MTMKKTLVIISFLISSAVWANEEETRKIYKFGDCVNRHIADVAKVLISIEEGSSLIKTRLCSDETSDLANFWATNRKDEQRPNFVDRYNSWSVVLTYDINFLLYKEKLKQFNSTNKAR